MLRLLVAALLVANLVFYAWTRGWLDDVVGVRAAGDREPERMARQVKPELIRILPPQSAASAVAKATCLEAGPFAADAIGGADAALQAALPAELRSAVATVKLDKPGQWMVYMGKYPTREALQKKIEELKRRNVRYDEVRSPPSLDGGLSLRNSRRRPTLPGGCPPSTIGASGLNFSVRNGKRCTPAAITAETVKGRAGA